MIERQLAKNEQLLEKAAEMRRHVAFLISGDAKGGSSELDAYLSVLRGMVNQNGSETVHGTSAMNEAATSALETGTPS